MWSRAEFSSSGVKKSGNDACGNGFEQNFLERSEVASDFEPVLASELWFSGLFSGFFVSGLARFIVNSDSKTQLKYLECLFVFSGM